MNKNQTKAGNKLKRKKAKINKSKVKLRRCLYSDLDFENHLQIILPIIYQ